MVHFLKRKLYESRCFECIGILVPSIFRETQIRLSLMPGDCGDWRWLRPCGEAQLERFGKGNLCHHHQSCWNSRNLYNRFFLICSTCFYCRISNFLVPLKSPLKSHCNRHCNPHWNPMNSPEFPDSMPLSLGWPQRHSWRRSIRQVGSTTVFYGETWEGLGRIVVWCVFWSKHWVARKQEEDGWCKRWFFGAPKVLIWP